MPRAVLLLAFTCCFGLSSSTLVVGQTAPADTAAAHRHKLAFLAAGKAAGFRNEARLNQYYRYRVDVTKTKELRGADIDLLQKDSVFRIDGQEDYKDGILYADVIVLATVVEQHDDSRRDVYFHSAFKVQVEEVWQGQLRTDTLIVQQHTGPIGGGLMVSSYGDPRLQMGKKMILYLNPIESLGLEASRAEGTWPYNINYKSTDYSVAAAYTVAGGKAYHVEELGPPKELRQVRREIQRIVAILDKAHFYQKSFAGVPR
jgi:hypothetical protein